MSNVVLLEQLKEMETTQRLLKVAPHQEGADRQLRTIEMDLERFNRYFAQREIYEQIGRTEKDIELENQSISKILTAQDSLGKNLSDCKSRLKTIEMDLERLNLQQTYREIYDEIERVEKEIKVVNQGLKEIIGEKHRMQAMEEIMGKLDKLEALPSMKKDR